MLSRLKRRLRALVHKDEMERELDEELRYHLEREIEQNLTSGMTPEEACSAALTAFGGFEQAKEECRDARGVWWLEEIWQDLRYGMRVFVRRPALMFTAVTTLPLGIGIKGMILSCTYRLLYAKSWRSVCCLGCPAGCSEYCPLCRQ